MSSVLVCWVGATDLRVSRGEQEGLGPIGQAVADLTLDEAVLLSNYPANETRAYRSWLAERFDGAISLAGAPFKNPTDFGIIYRQAVDAVTDVLSRRQKKGEVPELFFHLSPGTPAMAAVWIILSKTRFPAALIQSSQKFGVETVSVPFDISAEFIPELLRASDEELQRRSLARPPQAPEFDAIQRKCAQMEQLVARAKKVAYRSVPVLIEGESGTGKELFAAAIHNASMRKGKPFVAVNCGAIPKHLVESELFGHEKGAFTGATERRKGHFREADGGTLFLDELGELPLRTQVSLLRVLQEGEVTPVGGSKPTKVDVRIVAATNRNLAKEIEEGRFREDLFYRLAVAVLQLPPLRERKGDLGLLIDHLLENVNQESTGREPGYERKTLSPGARNLLLNHIWPGNVRELQNTLLRAAIWSDGATITKTEMQEAMLTAPAARADTTLTRSLGDGFDLDALVDDVKRHYVLRAKEEATGNKSRAARLLGFSNHQKLGQWIKNLGVDW